MTTMSRNMAIEQVDKAVKEIEAMRKQMLDIWETRIKDAVCNNWDECESTWVFDELYMIPDCLSEMEHVLGPDGLMCELRRP